MLQTKAAWLQRMFGKAGLLTHCVLRRTNKSTSDFESGPAQHAYLTVSRFFGKDPNGGTFLILLDLCEMMYTGSFFS
jgi:hypothetical protein